MSQIQFGELNNCQKATPAFISLFRISLPILNEGIQTLILFDMPFDGNSSTGSHCHVNHLPTIRDGAQLVPYT